jgi:hypothetical protein
MGCKLCLDASNLSVVYSPHSPLNTKHQYNRVYSGKYIYHTLYVLVGVLDGAEIGP